MKLYLYDHCPFCLRAEMAGNWKQVPFERVYVANDDSETCLRLIGVKQVPILVFDNGDAMGESLNIAREFDRMGAPQRVIRPRKWAQDILAHLEPVQAAINALVLPRSVRLDLPEFQTLPARQYFTDKKEKMLGFSFDHALAHSERYIRTLEPALIAISPFWTC